MDLSLSGNLNYAPPGGGSNVNLPLSVTGTYAAQSIGTLDVPSGSASGTTIAIGFGSVANPIGFYLKNRVGTGVNIEINSATPTFRLPSGGVVMVAGGAQPDANPLSGVDVILVGVTTAAGAIDFAVWGD